MAPVPFSFGTENIGVKLLRMVVVRIRILFDRKSRNESSISEVPSVVNADGRAKVQRFSKNGCMPWRRLPGRNTGRFFPQEGRKMEAEGLERRASLALKEVLQKETLVLSLGAKLNIALLASVYGWFANNETVHLGVL